MSVQPCDNHDDNPPPARPEERLWEADLDRDAAAQDAQRAAESLWAADRPRSAWGW